MTTAPQIARLLPRHFKILDLILAGHDNVTIAKALGVSTQTVAMVQKSPLFQQELVKRRRESQEVDIAAMDRQAHIAKAQSILEQNLEKASHTLVDLLDNDDPNVRLRGADKILSRVFDSNKTGNVVVNITAEQVQLLQLALKESSYASGIQVQSANRQDADGAEANGTVVCEDRGLEDRPADSGDAVGSEV